MIKLQNLTLQRGTQRLLNEADLTLHPGQKVGVVGANGAGKSSLFALLQGQVTADAGTCSLPSDWRVSHMRQEVDALERSAVDYVLDGDALLRRTQAELTAAEADHDGLQVARLHQTLDTLDAYTADARARKLLAGLGFTPEQWALPVSSFSGGWRMRLNLAQALMCPSELLLLDEPTNHLDLDTLLWLEQWLKAYSGTLLLISHDRDFLDAVVDHVVHVEGQGLNLYRGGYSQFERTRAERLAQQQVAYERQQAQRDHMQDFIRRFKAKATKARQAQSRLKALERMEELAPAHVDSPFDFRFRESDRLGNPLITLEKAELGYAGKVILSGVNMHIAPGARIGLLGPNGAGKSTLIKTLAGSLDPLGGHRQVHEHLSIGYFTQHQLDALDPQASPLLHLMRIAPREREQVLRDFLGGFDFRGERCDEPVAHFSGGQKARLALALLAWQKPNLLLLDEPTNHLDLEMRLALCVALQAFSGAMLLVSHDRNLLKSTTDEFWLVADGRAQAFDGDLDDYAKWLRDYRSEPTEASQREPERQSDKRQQRQNAAQNRQRLAPHRKRVETLERELTGISQSLGAIEQELADSGLYDQGRKEELRALLAEQGALRQRLEAVEESWLEAQEQLESLEQELSA